MKEKLTKQVKKGKKYLKRVKEDHLRKKYFTDNTLFFPFLLVCVRKLFSY